MTEKQMKQYELSQAITSALIILERIEMLQQMAISTPSNKISSYPIDVYARIIENPLKDVIERLSQCDELLIEI